MSGQGKESLQRRFARAAREARALALAPAALRMGIAVTLLVQAGRHAPSARELRGICGIAQGAPSGAGVPQLDALARLLVPLGVGQYPVLVAAGLAYGLCLVALLLGYRTRIAAAATWLAHVGTTMGAGLAGQPGAGQIVQVFLFCLILMPSGGALSLDRRLGRKSGAPEPGARDRGKRRPPGRGQGQPGQVVGQPPASTCTQEGAAPPGTLQQTSQGGQQASPQQR